MLNIPPDVYNRLQDVLLRCGLFESSVELKAIFVDERISCWRNSLPDARSTADRVNLIIDFLSRQSNAVGENALVLLLFVLSEQVSSGDVCHQQLISLADRLQQQLKVKTTQGMTKVGKFKLDKTQIIVAVIMAVATILTAYWQFVWKPSRPQAVEYVGYVFDKTTTESVHNAKVTLDFQGVPAIVYTDSEGVYRFLLNVESDRIVGRIRVDADNYNKYDRNITLYANNPNIENIRLTPH
jgi:hypothetical protein